MITPERKRYTKLWRMERSASKMRESLLLMAHHAGEQGEGQYWAASSGALDLEKALRNIRTGRLE